MAQRVLRTPWIRQHVPGLGAAWMTALDHAPVPTQNHGDPNTDPLATVTLDCTDEQLKELLKIPGTTLQQGE